MEGKEKLAVFEERMVEVEEVVMTEIEEEARWLSVRPRRRL